MRNIKVVMALGRILEKKRWFNVRTVQTLYLVVFGAAHVSKLSVVTFKVKQVLQRNLVGLLIVSASELPVLKSHREWGVHLHVRMDKVHRNFQWEVVCRGNSADA